MTASVQEPKSLVETLEVKVGEPRIFKRFTEKIVWPMGKYPVERNVRWYAFEGEEENKANWYSSVTSLVDFYVDPGLVNYFKDTTREKQEQVLERTGNIGTQLHKIIEADLQNKNPTVPAKFEQPFAMYQQLCEMHEIRIELCETPVYSPRYGYAGAVDFVGTFDGKPVIMDLKTGGKYKKQTGYQLAAYRNAMEELTGKQYGLVTLQVPRTGDNVSVYEGYTHFDWMFQSFLACRQLWRDWYFTLLNKRNWKWLKT